METLFLHSQVQELEIGCANFYLTGVYPQGQLLTIKYFCTDVSSREQFQFLKEWLFKCTSLKEFHLVFEGNLAKGVIAQDSYVEDNIINLTDGINVCVGLSTFVWGGQLRMLLKCVK